MCDKWWHSFPFPLLTCLPKQRALSKQGVGQSLVLNHVNLISYFKFILQDKKSPQGLDPAAAKPRSAAAGSRWQSLRHLEFGCRKCFIKHTKRPSEGLGWQMHRFMVSAGLKESTQSFSQCLTGAEREALTALFSIAQCLKTIDRGTSPNVTNRSLKARNHLSSTTPARLCRQSGTLWAGSARTRARPWNKAALAEDWGHRHLSTGFSISSWWPWQKHTPAFGCLSTLWCRCLPCPASPGLFGKPT